MILNLVTTVNTTLSSYNANSSYEIKPNLSFILLKGYFCISISNFALLSSVATIKNLHIDVAVEPVCFASYPFYP